MSCVELVIASTNVHKVRELRNMLKPLGRFDLLSLSDFPNYKSPEETGKTFEENAKLKAEHAAKTFGHYWVLAEDSGLVVPSLGGEPGVFSARYAGEGASDIENRKKLLEKMENLLDDERQAFFECVMVLASAEGVKKCVRGTCEGTILTKERGGGGFGYDPLFIKHGYSKTFAEIEESVKNRISHRRKAFDKLLPILETLSVKNCVSD